MPFLPGEIISTHYGKVFDELTMHKSTDISISLLQRDIHIATAVIQIRLSGPVHINPDKFENGVFAPIRNIKLT